MSEPVAVPVYRDRGWRVAVGVALLVIAAGFAVAVRDIGTEWLKHADYSHGFLLVPFVAFLLWNRRATMPARVKWPDLWGLPVVLAGVGLFVYGIAFNKARETCEYLGLVIALAGLAVTFCGRWKGLRWAALPLAFLLFACPMPYGVWQQVTAALQSVATAVSLPVFQTLGLTTHVEGRIIYVDRTRLEIIQACGGLSMVLAFVALAAAIAVLCPPTRPRVDRWIVLLSAVPIALVCNVTRIVISGLVLHWGFKDAHDLVVHDFAGWMMMPVALGLIWVEFKLIDWLFVRVEYLSMEEVAKVSFATAADEAQRRQRPDLGDRHPAAAFLPIGPTGTSHGATAAGGTLTPPPPPTTPGGQP